jgi:hypothetical protein
MDPDLFITIAFVSLAVAVALAAPVLAYYERRRYNAGARRDGRNEARH